MDQARRDVAPADIKRDREAEREPDEEQDAGRRVAPDALVPAVEQQPEGRPVARQRAVDRRPQVGAEDAGRRCISARAKAERRRSLICVPICSACTRRARASRWVSSSSATAASRSARSRRTSALGWAASSFGSRAELLEAGAGGVESRLKLVDDLAQALPDRVDLLAQPLQVGIGEVAPGERRILLVKLEP